METQVIFTDNSEKVLSDFRDAIIEALEEIGEKGVWYAQAEIRKSKPYYEGKPPKPAIDTGELLNSIDHKVVESESTVYIGTDVKQGWYTELGTGKFSIHPDGGTSKESWVYFGKDGKWHVAYPQIPRPFLKPAVTQHIPEYRNITVNKLKNV